MIESVINMSLLVKFIKERVIFVNLETAANVCL